MQFLHEKNSCGQTLLRLCARGSAIVAELLRLSASVPKPFLLETKGDLKKYSNIILDFTYLDRQNGKGPDFFEQLIEQNPVRPFLAPQSPSALHGPNDHTYSRE